MTNSKNVSQAGIYSWIVRNHSGKRRKCGYGIFFFFPHFFFSRLSSPWPFESQPFPKQIILDASKLKEFADDNFKFDENGRKFSKRVENTVGKGEIARNEQFLLFPQCFQKDL